MAKTPTENKTEKKARASFTLNPDTITLLNNLLKDGKYRSMSHAVEIAIKLLNETEKQNKKK
jgi:Arc/MetJ-type ribon-helix-helix transcriptional regulator